MFGKHKSRLWIVFLRNLLLGMLLPFIIILLVIASQMNKDVRQDKAGTYLTMADMMADNVNEVVQKYLSVVEIAAQNEKVLSMDSDDAETYLNGIISDSGEVWSHFLITDKAGTEIAHTDGKEHRGTSIADREYYLTPWQAGESIVCEPTFSKSTGRRVLAIGTPIEEAGTRKGVLVGFVRLEYISQVLNEYDITENNYVFMLNSDGMLSAHPDEQIVLQQNWLTGECDASVSSEAVDHMTATQKQVVEEMTSNQTGVLSGEDFVFAYAPVQTGGMSVCIAAPFTEAYEIVLNLFKILGVSILVAAIIGIIMSILMAGSISVPFTWIAEQTNALAHGKTALLERKMGYTKTKEMAELKEAVTFLASSLESMLYKLDTESRNMVTTVGRIASRMSDSNASANDTSATVQQLAANMEEVSATAAGVNESTTSTAETITAIARKSEESSAYAKECQTRARESEQKALEGKSSTNGMADEIRSVMTESIENSKKASDIEKLTADILSIANQTNMLALNASIEAARAGEAGKGFAVVAGQIRELAERSKMIANHIQEISRTVIGAVENLASNAGNMLEFIDQTVLKDYDVFVEIAQLYREDSTYLENVLSEFAVQAEELNQNTDAIKEGMDGIATTVSESTQGIVQVANATSDLVVNLGSIQKEVADNERISDELRKEVDKFRH